MLSIKRDILAVVALMTCVSSCVKISNEQKNIFGEEPTQLVHLMDSDVVDIPRDSLKFVQIYSTATELKNLHGGTLLGATLMGRYYNVEVVSIPEVEEAYLVFSEFYNRDKRGTTYWALVDSVKIDMPQGTLIGWTGSVMYRGKIDPELLVLLPEEDEWLYIDIYEDILNAWRFDKETRKIYTIPTDSLTCVNESYSLY